MSKKLILGDGLLGSYLHKQTSWDYISRKKDGIDFINLESYRNLLDGYEEIINCIACTDTYSKDRQKHWDTNYKAVSDLVDHCNKTNKKLIHISTDYLYTYSKINATEDDVPVHCENWYGYTKLLADGYIQLKSNNYLILRETHKKTPFTYEYAYINQLGNFNYIDKIGNLIIQLIEKNTSGIYNVGTDATTMFHLAKETKPEVKSTRDLFDPSTPTNTTMDISKMKNTLFL